MGPEARYTIPRHPSSPEQLTILWIDLIARRNCRRRCRYARNADRSLFGWVRSLGLSIQVRKRCHCLVNLVIRFCFGLFCTEHVRPSLNERKAASPKIRVASNLAQSYEPAEARMPVSLPVGLEKMTKEGRAARASLLVTAVPEGGMSYHSFG